MAASKKVIVVSSILHGSFSLFLIYFGIAIGSWIFSVIGLALALGSMYWVRKQLR